VSTYRKNISLLVSTTKLFREFVLKNDSMAYRNDQQDAAV